MIRYVKLPFTRLDRPQRLQKFEVDRNFRQSTYEVSKVFSPTQRPPLVLLLSPLPHLTPNPLDIPGTLFCYRLLRPNGRKD
jgi:hypothetical protein